MKKIICFFATFIAGFIILCVPSFAAGPEPVDFDDWFVPSDIIIVGVDEANYDEGYVQDTRTYYATPLNTGLRYSSAHLRLKFKQSYIKGGSRIMFDMKVKIIHNSNFDSVDRVWPKLLLRNQNAWVQVGWSEVVVGDDTPGLYSDTLIYHVDYECPEDIVDPLFTLDWISDPTQSVPFNSVSYTFPDKVTDFYIGDGNDPSLPNFTNPENEFGGTLDEYANKENEILGETEEGKEIFSSSMTWVFEALGYFSFALTAIGRAFEFVLVELNWLHYLVRFSLAIGLVAFVLNIGSSIFKSFTRRKGDG